MTEVPSYLQLGGEKFDISPELGAQLQESLSRLYLDDIPEKSDQYDEPIRWSSELGRRVLRDFFTLYDQQTSNSDIFPQGFRFLVSYYLSHIQERREIDTTYIIDNPFEDVAIAIVFCCGGYRRQVADALKASTGYSRSTVQNKATLVTSLTAQLLKEINFEVRFKYTSIAKEWLSKEEEGIEEVEVAVSNEEALVLYEDRRLAESYKQLERLELQSLYQAAIDAYAQKHPEKKNVVKIFLDFILGSFKFDTFAKNLGVGRSRAHKVFEEVKSFLKVIALEGKDVIHPYANLFDRYFLYEILESLERNEEALKRELGSRFKRFRPEESFELAKEVMERTYTYYRMGRSHIEIMGIINKNFGVNGVNLLQFMTCEFLPTLEETLRLRS